MNKIDFWPILNFWIFKLFFKDFFISLNFFDQEITPGRVFGHFFRFLSGNLVKMESAEITIKYWNLKLGVVEREKIVQYKDDTHMADIVRFLKASVPKSDSIVYSNLRVHPDFEGEYSLNTPAKLILKEKESYYYVYGKPNFESFWAMKDGSSSCSVGFFESFVLILSHFCSKFQNFFPEKIDFFLFFNLFEEKEEAKIDSNVYEEIKKYMFYESGTKWVKVRIDLEGIGELPKESFKVEFGIRSLDVKILGYKGKNLRLRVPKTHYTYDFAKSKYVVKDKKIIISLRKKNETDSWFTLHKQNLVNEGIDEK